jgi:hypothetical protein
MLLLVGLAATMLGPASALGFQQTMTCTQSGLYACEPGEEPKAVHWNARCVRYRINENGTNNFTRTSKDIPAIEELRRSVAQSFAAWTQVPCSDMTLVDGGLTSHTNAKFDPKEPDQNSNLVIWRDQGWSQVASARAFALTSVTFNPRNGVIADADIEVNTEFYKFSAGEEPKANHVDMRNTMTHEVGHFIGLDHTEVREATMFSTAPVGETAKRSLHPDDIEGLCTTYPSSGQETQRQCNSASDFPSGDDLDLDGGVCTVTGIDASPPSSMAMALLSILGLLGLAAWRKTTNPCKH